MEIYLFVVLKITIFLIRIKAPREHVQCLYNTGVGCHCLLCHYVYLTSFGIWRMNETCEVP